MNLKGATVILIIGLLYTLLYKIIIGLVPSINEQAFFNFFLSVLWVLSALSIIVFNFYFLRDTKSQNIIIRFPLHFIIAFTIIIIVNLQVGIISNMEITTRLISNILRVLNIISILYFLGSFARLNSDKKLNGSIKLMIWAFSLGLLLNIISFGGILYFIIFGGELYVFSKLQIFAILIFAFVYYSVISFLIKFMNVEDYSKLLRN